METQFGLIRGTIPCSWRMPLDCSSFTTTWHEDLTSSSTTGAKDAGGDSAHLQPLLVPSAEAERQCHSLDSTSRGRKQKVEDLRSRKKVLLQQDGTQQCITHTRVVFDTSPGRSQHFRIFRLKALISCRNTDYHREHHNFFLSAALCFPRLTNRPVFTEDVCGFHVHVQFLADI